MLFPFHTGDKGPRQARDYLPVLGMSFNCGENCRVKHSNCVHLNGGGVLPLPLKCGRFKGGDLQ